MRQGLNGSWSLSVQPANGFAGEVSFGVSGLPTGVSASFAPATVTGSGATTLTVAVGSSAPVGTYPFTVTATGGAIVHTAAGILAVIDKDYSLSVSPGTLEIVANNLGTSFSYTTTLTPVNGFDGTVTFGVGGFLRAQYRRSHRHLAQVREHRRYR